MVTSAIIVVSTDIVLVLRFVWSFRRCVTVLHILGQCLDIIWETKEIVIFHGPPRNRFASPFSPSLCISHSNVFCVAEIIGVYGFHRYEYLWKSKLFSLECSSVYMPSSPLTVRFQHLIFVQLGVPISSDYLHIGYCPVF